MFSKVVISIAPIKNLFNGQAMTITKHPNFKLQGITCVAYISQKFTNLPCHIIKFEQ